MMKRNVGWDIQSFEIVQLIEVLGLVMPQLLIGGPLGWLWALRLLRPCDPRNNALDSEKSKKNHQEIQKNLVLTPFWEWNLEYGSNTTEFVCGVNQEIVKILLKV